MPILSLAQKVYEGQVIDKVTENTLPGVTVTLQKGHTIVITDQQGHFRLNVENAIANDTLIFTSVGYDAYKLPVANFEQKMLISLQPGNALLKEVNVAAAKIKTSVLGKFNSSDIKEINSTAYKYFTMPFSASVGAPLYRSSYAKFFEAPQENSVLAMIKLGRRDFESNQELGYMTTASKYTRFLVHILTVNPDDGEPGKTIFTKEISLTDNSRLITIDLSKDKIVIPGNKFFIAIEWLIIPLNEIISLGYAEKIEKVRQSGSQLKFDAAVYSTLYQPCLVQYTRYHSERPWLRLGKMGWNTKGMPELSEIEPAKLWVKDDGKWKQLLSTHEVALSVTLHY